MLGLQQTSSSAGRPATCERLKARIERFLSKSVKNRHICINNTQTQLAQTDVHRAVDVQTHAGAREAVVRHPVAKSCNLAHACEHVFGSALRGIAGRFTR